MIEGPDAKKLMRHKPKVLSLGSYLDTTAYPGEEALYVVAFEDGNPPKGMVFVFFVLQRDRRHTFRAENNATFVLRKKGIEFLDPPLGGAWTQEHMEDAIDRIGQDAMYLFSIKDARGPSADVTCESYADAR